MFVAEKKNLDFANLTEVFTCLVLDMCVKSLSYLPCVMALLELSVLFLAIYPVVD